MYDMLLNKNTFIIIIQADDWLNAYNSYILLIGTYTYTSGLSWQLWSIYFSKWTIAVVLSLEQFGVILDLKVSVISCNIIMLNSFYGHYFEIHLIISFSQHNNNNNGVLDKHYNLV